MRNGGGFGARGGRGGPYQVQKYLCPSYKSQALSLNLDMLKLFLLKLLIRYFFYILKFVGFRIWATERDDYGSVQFHFAPSFMDHF
jgi:hypothetical protein